MIIKKVLSILLFLVHISAFATDYNIINFGAKEGKNHINTKAIQNAIDSCAISGGKVIIPTGIFKTGSLHLKSNLTLFLQKGAVLLGSNRAGDYPEHQPKFASYTNRYQLCALLFAENAENISITGEGVIDCNGGTGDFYMTREEWKSAENERKRPFGILMRRCKNIRLCNVTLKNSAFWMQQYLECENLRFSNINVINHANYNNDGLDLNNCKDVIVEGCRIYCSDDAIAVKSTTPKRNENIVITGCILRSHYNGFKIGTETNGGVSNLVLTNCVIGSPGYENHHGSNHIGFSGIALECCDGATIENIAISNITIDSMMTPFFIRLENRGRKISSKHAKQATGTLQNVNISNVIATNMTKLTSSITGIPGHDVENIRLNNIQIFTSGGGTIADTKKTVPEKESAYPDVVMFETDLPAYGLYIRHAKGIFISDVAFHTQNQDARYGIVLDDVKNAYLNQLLFDSKYSENKNFNEINCKNIQYSNIMYLKK